jgi:D-alanyl-lipoteichoic acid acyltransferase DltB (MBOAT superfamily)
LPAPRDTARGFSAVCSLAYFKYAGFEFRAAGQLAQWPIPAIPLPIGISVCTFTQIAFPADTFRGAATNCARRIIFRSWPFFAHRAVQRVGQSDRGGGRPVRENED